MEIWEERSRFGPLINSVARNSSSSSTAFYSANESSFFSPRLSSSSTGSDALLDVVSSVCTSTDLQKLDLISSSTGISDSSISTHTIGHGNNNSWQREQQRNEGRRQVTSFIQSPTSFASNRLKSCDVYIGFLGRKPSLLKFVNWLRAELEVQGISCFVTDRSLCRNYRKHDMVEQAMDACTFGVVILTRKSFKNPYTIKELRFFAIKKNLVPIYFDLGPEDCGVRDIVEKRGEIWEKLGGELWRFYNGLEDEWREALNGLVRIDEWNLEAHDGKWRDCILRAVTLLALRLGRRSVVDRINKWREKAEKEEFPFPRNENFVGRNKELSELEYMLVGDVSAAEKICFELKARRRRKKLITTALGKNSSTDEKGKEKQRVTSKRKGKEPVVWTESEVKEQEPESSKRKGKEPVVWTQSEKEIEMKVAEIPQMHHQASTFRRNGKHGRLRRSTKGLLYGKGVGCVSGESGIGKTELLLEYAYRYHQRYKMVLWIGGESKYICQNYLNLWSYLEVDVGVESGLENSGTKSFEEHEDAALLRVRKELMRNIPFLVVIDNLESEKDWWNHKLIMDILPRFGGETHVVISTRLSHVMNMETLRLSYLSRVERMSLMQRTVTDYPVADLDALGIIDIKVGRLTLGLAVIGAILSELPINPRRLLDTINRIPSREVALTGREFNALRRNVFLLQLFEFCLTIFDDADGARSSLATRMVMASGWFAPSPIPVSLLAVAAHKLPAKLNAARLWKKVLHSLTFGVTSPSSRKSEAEASSLLVRFNIARRCKKDNHIQFNDLIKLYARKKGVPGVSARAMVRSIISRGCVLQHADHIWAACFLCLQFERKPVAVELKVTELLHLAKEKILPLGTRTFLTFSHCKASLDLLRICTEAIEAAEEMFLEPVEKLLDKSVNCWRPSQTSAQLDPRLWNELALLRADFLEIRAKLMVRGGQFDIADDLIRKTIFIRISICGEDHPATKSANELLSKIARLLSDVQILTSQR